MHALQDWAAVTISVAVEPYSGLHNTKGEKYRLQIQIAETMRMKVLSVVQHKAKNKTINILSFEWLISRHTGTKRTEAKPDAWRRRRHKNEMSELQNEEKSNLPVLDLWNVRMSPSLIEVKNFFYSF